MEIKEAVEILNEWIYADRTFRDNDDMSMFDKYCEERNVAIETIISELRIENINIK